MGASVRALQLHGSAAAIVDYVEEQTVPDTAVAAAAAAVDYYKAGLSEWEPLGRWRGRQAECDGLGPVRRKELARVVCGLDPNTGMPNGRLPRQGAVVAWDLTFTAPKSISAWWALSPTDVRREIGAAIDRAAEVAIGLVNRDGAQTRVGRRDAVQVVDSHGLRAAQFRQVTSRAGDPHLHVHTLIGARVRATDGTWHALDARWLVRYQQTVGRVFDHELAVELGRRLGVRIEWTDGHPEIAGIPKALRERWSRRSAEITADLDRAVSAFTAEQGREPTALERVELEHRVWQDSRTRKPDLPSLAALEDRWAADAREFDLGPTAPELSTRRARSDNGALIQAAQSRLEDERSTWTRADVLDALARTAADVGVAMTLDRLDHLVDAMAGSWIETPAADIVRSPRRADGASRAWSAVVGRYTSDRVVTDEATIAAVALRAHAHPPSQSDTVDVDGLDAAQRAAARVLAGESRLPIVVGAAGTAKTTLVARAVADVVARGDRVLLLAPTRVAASQLAAVTAARPPDEHQPVTVDTIAGYLTRLAYQPQQVDRFGLVLVDEAGMVTTGDLARLLDIGEQRGHRTALVGDWAQLGPVGRGGMFARLVRHHSDGHLVELTTVHRFTAQWEQDASLRLRLGDRAVLDDYRLNSRLRAGTLADAAEHAARQWLAGEQLLVTCATNETARAVAGHIQARLRHAGLVDPTRTVVLADGHTAGAGDYIATRLNLRQRTDRGELVANRHRWTIDRVHAGGSITVTGEHGTARLDADYVAAHVELAYAGTAHAAQGVTVHQAVVLVDEQATHQTVYVGATRGRHHNLLWMITTPGEQPDDDDVMGTLAAALERDQRDSPVLDHAAMLRSLDHALAEQIDQSERVRRAIARLRQVHARPPGGRGLSR